MSMLRWRLRSFQNVRHSLSDHKSTFFSRTTKFLPNTTSPSLYLFNVFCFSASLTSFLPLTIRPFLFLTPSIYLLATFSLSASSPKSSKSSSVNGTQNGSSSRISKPWKISCGEAAPDVRLRISSEKPKDSATGTKERMVKKGVPSLRDSERMRPRRRVSTS
jgi:hypothetical protein